MTEAVLAIPKTKKADLEVLLNMWGWGHWSEARSESRHLQPKMQPIFRNYQPGWRVNPNPPYIDEGYALKLDKAVAQVAHNEGDLYDILILYYGYGFSSSAIGRLAKSDHRVITGLIEAALNRIYERLS